MRSDTFKGMPASDQILGEVGIHTYCHEAVFPGEKRECDHCGKVTECHLCGPRNGQQYWLCPECQARRRESDRRCIARPKAIGRPVFGYSGGE